MNKNNFDHLPRYRWGTPLILCLALLTAAPCVSQAQDLKARAKSQFLAGVDHFADADYNAALEAFQRSYELVPKAKLLFNIGMCQKALFQFRDAVLTFRKYLREEGNNISAEKRQQTEEAIADMMKMVGSLLIKNAPDGASVRVDNQYVGQTPFDEPIILNPGQHKVRIEKMGFEPLVTRIKVDADVEIPMRATLVAAKGALKIECEGADAVVTIDGQKAGGCPFEGRLTPGEHEIRVTRPGMKPVQTTVTVNGTQTSTFPVRFVPEEATEKTVDSKMPQSETQRPLLIGGAVTTALGLGGVAVGAFFSFKASQDVDANQNIITQNENKEYQTEQDFIDAFNRTKSDRDSHVKFMAVGFAVGGTLTAAGIVLMTLGLTGRSSLETQKVSVSASGVTVRF